MKPRSRYTPEFKQRAVARLVSGQVSLRQVAKELEVSVPTLIKWRKEEGMPGKGLAARGNKGATPELGELERLRAEVDQLREERDRLRLGIAYLVGVKVSD